MCRKIFAMLVIIIALVMAILVSVLPQDRLASLFYVSRFIEVMIPILGAGALIKYLFSCHKRKSHRHKKGSQNPTMKTVG